MIRHDRIVGRAHAGEAPLNSLPGVIDGLANLIPLDTPFPKLAKEAAAWLGDQRDHIVALAIVAPAEQALVAEGRDNRRTTTRLHTPLSLCAWSHLPILLLLCACCHTRLEAYLISRRMRSAQR